MNKHREINILKTIAFLMFIVGLISCEEPYIPDVETKYENVLVVDGMITDAPGPYTIKLSSTVMIDRIEYIPVSGFEVMISDDAGHSEVLSETEPGKYTSDTNGIQGIPGRSYQLTLHSPAGKSYQSYPEKLHPAVGIDSVYAHLEYHPDASTGDLAGYQFYVDTQPSDSDSTCFLWSLTATYKYTSDLIIRWIFDGTLRPFTAFDSLRTCWKTKAIPDIFIHSSAGLSSSSVEAFPLHFVGVNKRDLSIRYSLFTEQLVISQEAYNFWHHVKEQNSTNDQLYPKLPFQIRGNMYNPQNPNELILGYFMVAGSQSKRIFINRPSPPVQMSYTICTLSEAEYYNFSRITLTPSEYWPVYATYDNNGANALPDNQYCMNCILKGGTIVKPAFWIDE